jgi:hypothetical protein
MEKYNENLNSGQQLLINESPLLVLPSLVKAVGLNRAIFLQQVQFWLSNKGAHMRDGRRWIFNSLTDWQEQLPFWTTQNIQKITQQLRDMEVLLTTDKYNQRRGDKTLWYSIDYEQLHQLIANNSGQQPHNSGRQGDNSGCEPDNSGLQRYQETTQETTQESISLTPNGVSATNSQNTEKPARINHIKMLVDNIEMLGGFLSDQQKRQYAGQVAQLRKKGVSESDISLAVMRRAADYQRFPAASLQESLAWATGNPPAKRIKLANVSPDYTAEDYERGIEDM